MPSNRAVSPFNSERNAATAYCNVSIEAMLQRLCHRKSAKSQRFASRIDRPELAGREVLWHTGMFDGSPNDCANLTFQVKPRMNAGTKITE
jgi:hypothetical protein